MGTEKVDEYLRNACVSLRDLASKQGKVCGPCKGCSLEPYYTYNPDDLEEWVEWSWHSYSFRCRPDGSHQQERCGSGEWVEYTIEQSSIGAAYRAGLQVRDAKVKELVEAVENLPDWEGAFVLIRRAKAAAKAVKL